MQRAWGKGSFSQDHNLALLWVGGRLHMQGLCFGPAKALIAELTLPGGKNAPFK